MLLPDQQEQVCFLGGSERNGFFQTSEDGPNGWDRVRGGVSFGIGRGGHHRNHGA